jgi:serine protease Do
MEDSSRSQVRAFLIGLSISVVLLAAFFFGAVSDRVFVLKPVDYLIGKKKDALTSPNSQQSQAAPTILNSEEKTVVNVAETASKSVLTVSIKKQARQMMNPFPDQGSGFGFDFVLPSPGLGSTKPIQQDIGSGFVIEKGLVVTNKHVVSEVGAEYLAIDQNDKEHKITKIYRDPANDLAVLKIDDLDADPLQLGDSDSLKVGQSAIAIGTALGEFRHTVTTGVVSGLGRGIQAGDPFGDSVESLENVIQTDAAINPGNSGGPLLDSSGKVIGVNVAVSASGQNIGFAIPINVIKNALKTFNATGKFERPFMGVRYRMITEQAALLNSVPQGAYVVEVVPNSAAADAGLQVGDIITQFDGKSVKDNDVSKIINSKKIGDKVKVEYWRKDQKKTAELTLKGQE